MPAPQLPDLPEGPSLDRLRGPVEIPRFETWEIIGMSTAAAVLTGLAIWAILALVRKRKSKTPPIDPRTAALKEIEAAKYCSDDDGRFAQITAGALLRFCEKDLGIPTLGQTTKEFTASLSRLPDRQAEDSKRVKKFLSECDQIKFSQKKLSTSERERLSETAAHIIGQFSERKEAVET
ncbi:MAG: hypothetical protein AAGH40_10325 [Verrucomicrobiota bacterium]